MEARKEVTQAGSDRRDAVFRKVAYQNRLEVGVLYGKPASIETDMAITPDDGVMEKLRRIVLFGHDSPITDGGLLSRFVEWRDELAFQVVVRRHGPMVFSVRNRILRHRQDAEDAFQATFLVLARKAACIASRELLGNWLYGVAVRTSVRAKVLNVKRKRREKLTRWPPDIETTTSPNHNDFQSLLDQELSRLPNRYRAPIVLCDLEGKTRKEASLELGWPEGSVAGRLARGRMLLKKRLGQRGVILSGGSLATILEANAVAATVSSTLVTSTTKAACAFASDAFSGLISAKVVFLARGTFKTMILARVNTVLAVTFVAGIVALGARPLCEIVWADGQDVKKPIGRQLTKPEDDKAKKAMQITNPRSAHSLQELRAGVEKLRQRLFNSELYVKYRMEATTRQPPAEHFFPWLEITFAMRQGENKFYCEHLSPSASVGELLLQKSAFNGEVGTNLTGKTGQVLKKSIGVYWLDIYFQQLGFPYRPKDRMRAETAVDEFGWLPWNFDRLDYKLRPEQEMVDGAWCEVVTAAGLDTLWIDAVHGFLLRKREINAKNGALKLRILNRSVKELEPGLWLPAESTREDFKASRDPNTLILSQSIKVSEFHVNKNRVPPDFKIAFPPGTFVDDEVLGMRYQVSP